MERLEYAHYDKDTITETYGFLNYTRFNKDIKDIEVVFDDKLSLVKTDDKDEIINFYKKEIQPLDDFYSISSWTYHLVYKYEKDERKYQEDFNRFLLLVTSIRLLTKKNSDLGVYFSINRSAKPIKYYKPFYGDRNDYHMKDQNKSFITNSEELNLLKDLYTKLIKLDLYKEPKFSRLKNAVEFFNRANDTHWVVLKITMLFIALESLFSDTKDEISYKIRLRTAFFLYPENKERRKQIFELLKIGYDIRSKFLHGSELNDSKNQKKLEKITGKEDYSVLFDFPLSLYEIVNDVIFKILTENRFYDFFSKNKSEDEDAGFFDSFIL